MAYTSTHKAAPQAGMSDSGWQPSVKYLLVLLIAEIIVFGFLRTFAK
jgi:hypothetical protein